MKKIKLLFLLLFLAVFPAFSASRTKQIIIINGYFFNELPSAVKNNRASADTKFFTIRTPEGIKATCIYSPSLTLSQESLEYAVPVENVDDGTELLRRYNEQKENQSISFSLTDAIPKINIGDKFPDFSAVDIDGKTWTNSDIERKVTVLNLWFTDCGPCCREMPELSEWKNEMPDVMFFSSTYESPEIARQVLDKGSFNWIHLVNDTQFKKWIGVKGYPLTIIIDKDGKIAAFEYGTSPEQRGALKNKISILR